MIFVIVALAFLNFALVWFLVKERIRRNRMKQDIDYIENKMKEIVENNTMERIKLMTVDEETKRMLNVLNEVLNYNHKNLVKYRHSQESTKKMLSNISHDLKTPLTVILGYLEMLCMKYPEEESVFKAYRRTQDVIELINKFFDLAKMESGDRTFSKQRLDLCELCRKCVLDFYQMLEDNHMDVDIQIPEQPIYVMANEEAILRILNNLISNAIKYGGQGKYLGVLVTDEKEEVTVKIIDHGKGIEKEHSQEVFERMYTLEDSRSKEYQGSGLGLTITKELVEQMGGTIHLDSIPNKETVFSFVLSKMNY